MMNDEKERKTKEIQVTKTMDSIQINSKQKSKKSTTSKYLKYNHIDFISFYFLYFNDRTTDDRLFDVYYFLQELDFIG